MDPINSAVRRMYSLQSEIQVLRGKIAQLEGEVLEIVNNLAGRKFVYVKTVAAFRFVGERLPPLRFEGEVGACLNISDEDFEVLKAEYGLNAIRVEVIRVY